MKNDSIAKHEKWFYYSIDNIKTKVGKNEKCSENKRYSTVEYVKLQLKMTRTIFFE